MLELWTNPNCVWCERAHVLLGEKNAKYITKISGVDFTTDELKLKFPFAKTYPVVVLDNKFLGGYIELLDHLTIPKTDEKP
jgi:glutaredoxin